MKFEMEGLDALILGLEELAALPDEVLLEMLEAEAEVIKAAQVRSIQETFSAQRTHQLEQSLKVNSTMTPSGTRENGVRNAEVAFVEEFGAKNRGIPAHQWMRRANESAADDAVEAAARVYDQHLEDKGL